MLGPLLPRLRRGGPRAGAGAGARSRGLGAATVVVVVVVDGIADEAALFEGERESEATDEGFKWYDDGGRVPGAGGATGRGGVAAESPDGRLHHLVACGAGCLLFWLLVVLASSAQPQLVDPVVEEGAARLVVDEVSHGDDRVGAL